MATTGGGGVGGTITKSLLEGVLSNRVERGDLKPGDHIYSWRTAYTYAHHGIYIGDEHVIHFTRGNGLPSGRGTILEKIISGRFSPANSSTQCGRCGGQSALGGVLISCLDCFLSGGHLYLFHYAVSTAFFLAKRGGTCTLAASDSAEDVLHRAIYLLQNGFGTYCIFKKNCEDFAVYCKTGLLETSKFGIGLSGQIGSYVYPRIDPLSLVLSPLYRYLLDVGVRRNVQKIPVERLVAELNPAE